MLQYIFFLLAQCTTLMFCNGNTSRKQTGCGELLVVAMPYDSTPFGLVASSAAAGAALGWFAQARYRIPGICYIGSERKWFGFYSRLSLQLTQNYPASHLSAAIRDVVHT